MSGKSEMGSRGRLKADTADSWLCKKLQIRAERGVSAVVTGVIGTGIPYSGRSFHIDFEKQGRLPAMHGSFRARDLELLA